MKNFRGRKFVSFWDRCDAKSSGCWNWKLALNDRGYGQVMYRGRVMQAHRAAWLEASGGEIPDGIFVCHKCDNRACVRPAHLFLGTPQDNSTDMKNKGRAPSGEAHYRTGTNGVYSSGVNNGRAKLTEADVLAIREAFKHERFGLVADLSRQYGVSRTTIVRVGEHLNWRNV